MTLSVTSTVAAADTMQGADGRWRWRARDPQVAGRSTSPLSFRSADEADADFALHAAAPDRWLHAAGGVRDIADIETLALAGISGALVATSLHDGRLSASDLVKARSL